MFISLFYFQGKFFKVYAMDCVGFKLLLLCYRFQNVILNTVYDVCPAGEAEDYGCKNKYDFFSGDRGEACGCAGAAV